MSAITERWKAADAGGIAGLFTDDGDVVTLSGGILEGRAAVRDFLRPSSVTSGCSAWLGLSAHPSCSF